MSATDDTDPGTATPSPVLESRRRRSRVRLVAEHGLFSGVTAVLRGLSPQSASRLGARLARLYLAVASSRRTILRGNLSAAFPELPAAEIAALARKSAENVGASFVEFLDSPRHSREEIERRVRVVGGEHLASARARGKGVFVLSAHFGSWELGAVRAGMLGEPIASVVRPLDNPLLEQELARRRTRFGNRLIGKWDAAKEILRDIRQGRTVAILIDQNVLPGEGIFVPFFGRPAATTPSLALLQLKTEAPVVPAFAWPEGNGRYRLEFEEPILAEQFASAGSREERVRLATARYMAVTERAIRRDPAAWLWMHNRWRTRPEEGSDG